MPPKKKRLSTTSAESTSPPHESPPETQFVPLDDDEENMWEAEAILDENVLEKTFLLKWVGVDPKDNQPWENSWEPKNGVTQSLIDEWKEKKKRDPMLIGKFSREENKRKEAVEAAKAAQAAKARKAKAEQARKRKRTEDSSRSTESPKKARKAGERACHVHVQFAHAFSGKTGFRCFGRIVCDDKGHFSSAQADCTDYQNGLAEEAEDGRHRLIHTCSESCSRSGHVVRDPRRGRQRGGS